MGKPLSIFFHQRKKLTNKKYEPLRSGGWYQFLVVRILFFLCVCVSSLIDQRFIYTYVYVEPNCKKGASFCFQGNDPVTCMFMRVRWRMSLASWGVSTRPRNRQFRTRAARPLLPSCNHRGIHFHKYSIPHPIRQRVSE